MPISLQTVRELLQRENLSAVVVPTGDPHASEYPCRHWELRKALCPFTGSAGTLVITPAAALLWTDSRYWEQASRELNGSGFELMQDGSENVPSIEEWLSRTLQAGVNVGLDGSSTPLQTFARWKNRLSENGISLTDVSPSLYRLWTDRPSLLTTPVLPFHSFQRPRSEKLAAVRNKLREIGADTLLVTALDDVAWLSNLRGLDVQNTPVFVAYFLIQEKTATLFIDPRKIGPATIRALYADAIECRPYDEIEPALKELPASSRLLLDPAQINLHLFDSALSHVQTIRGTNPVTQLKTIKTPEEIQSVRSCMVLEGIALVKLFSWIEDALSAGDPPTEWNVAEKLLSFRKEAQTFVESSFETIAATGANAALPHYAPSAASSCPLAKDSVLLLDCGGQYLGATTDITRTISLGLAPESLRRDYTAVLRGHIAFATARFPEGLHAGRIDSLARAPLWEIGADYGHGTGHGVGFFLSVHEPPLSVSPRTPTTDAVRLVRGMILSNEPGVYRTGLWGVRLENLVTPKESGIPDFLDFETLSLCPFDKKLIIPEMLTKKERQWIDDYHAAVYNRLSLFLGENHRKWLERATSPL